ncbi:MAG: M1 family aminopeptidase, partial [Acidimicrobiia bacterium]
PTFGYRRGTGTFRYTVPSGMVVEATGNLTSVQDRDGRTVHTFESVIPSVFDFVAGTFRVQRRQGPVPVSVYHLGRLDRVEEILERTERIIGALETEFGPYPFDQLAIVEVPMEPALFAGIEGGAYPGYFLIRSDLLQPDTYEDWVVGHELTHFWFPHVVGHREEPIAPAMLDEALAHYGALRVVEAIGGPATAEQFRRDGAREAIRLTAAGFDHPLAGVSKTERWNRVAYNLSNTKGHLVYDMLARTIGRGRFQTALRNVIRDHAGGEIGWADFWRAIQDAADEELDWFSLQWLESSAIPVLTLDWAQEGDQLACVVTQSEPHFRLVVPLQIELADGSAHTHLVEVRDEKASVTLEVDRAVHRVTLDPHFTTLHATPAAWEEAVARRFVTRGKLLWDDDEFEQALDVFRDGIDELTAADEWGIECLTRTHIGWLHQSQGRLEEATAQYDLALACAVRPDDCLPRLYVNIATVAKERDDHDRMKWAAINALAAERSLGRETEVGRAALEMLQEPPS